MSYAVRVVVPLGSVPASGFPRRRWVTGNARPTRTTSAPMAYGNGWRWMRRLHRNQNAPRVAVDDAERRRAGTWNVSMLWPTKPSIAGSRVTEANIVTRTAIADPTARPLMNDSPI